MNNDSTFQETLFADPLGLRFRHAREKARWSKEAVAQQLKLPTAVVDAIEREDWARLGAPIYVRSYVGSYAKLLGLPPELAEDLVRDKPTPQLVYTGANTGARRMLDRSMRNIAYLVMTAVIVGSIVMLAMRFQAPAKLAQVVPLDAPIAAVDRQAVASGTTASTSVSTVLAQSAAATNTADAPVMASLAPVLPSAASSPGNDLQLTFRAQSWIEVLDPNGQSVERGLVPAGSTRHYTVGQVSHITLGNADAVDVSQAGRLLDMAPYRQANIARFNFSSAGMVVPPAG